MIETRVRCNDCAANKCLSFKSTKASKGCSMFVSLGDFKVPMLVHLMENHKAINTTKMLEQFGFEVSEIGYYPYFKLYMKGK